MTATSTAKLAGVGDDAARDGGEAKRLPSATLPRAAQAEAGVAQSLLFEQRNTTSQPTDRPTDRPTKQRTTFSVSENTTMY